MSRLKKLGLFFILLFIFICVAIGVLILKIEYFDPYNSVNYSEMIDTEIPKNAKVLDYKDTHGGFLGDGDLYAVIQFDKNEKNSFLKNIEKNKKWKKTPLQKDLKLIIYGGELKKDGNYVTIEKKEPGGELEIEAMINKSPYDTIQILQQFNDKWLWF